ncbi:MAG TPA: SpoIIE family protein phosphatase [Acidimicrobiales bacterium]|nr:SpoIIE family protein phosphatase [Acidimicrobiales bacterium]
MTVEVCWRPAQGETSGDFHDIVDLFDGRVAVILGDAPSSGAVAAELGEQLRFELRRALRSRDHGPDLLRPLDDLMASRGMDKIATVVIAVLDPDRRHAEVTNAGHLPILVTSGSQAHFLEERVDPPLGVVTPRRSITYELVDESALFMFTDGLVERRGASLTDGLATAREVARGMTGAAASAAELARRATDRLGQPTDDATAMSVRLRSPEPFARISGGQLTPARRSEPVPGSGQWGGPGLGTSGNGGSAAAPTAPAGAALRVYLDPTDLISMRAQRVVEDMVSQLSARILIDVDFIDIAVSPDLADSDGVLAAPTVVRLLPRPPVKVVGGLRSASELARALQLPFSEEIS